MATDFVQRPVRILHLEDNENDQVLVREMLLAEGLACEFIAVKTREDFDSAVRQNKYRPDYFRLHFAVVRRPPRAFPGARSLPGNSVHFLLRHHWRGSRRRKPQKRRGGLRAQTTAEPAGAGRPPRLAQPAGAGITQAGGKRIASKRRTFSHCRPSHQ